MRRISLWRRWCFGLDKLDLWAYCGGLDKLDLRAYRGGLDKLDLRVGGAGYGPVPHTMGAASTSGNFFSAYLRYCWMWSAIASAEAAGSRSAIAS